ncbi:hypothetical protein Btru_062900 [Bulinus truncatus]|nr:hypothetical protein Btru_062900 [Bulinus truncatus]
MCGLRSSTSVGWFARQLGDLATVNSEEKFSLLMRGRDAVWIGLHKVHGTNYFKWVDDDAPLEEGFQHSQLFAPDRFSRLSMRMECVMLDRQRRGLKLYPCFYRLSYVCQYVPNSYRANYTKL